MQHGDVLGLCGRMTLQLSSNVTDALVGQLAPLTSLRELSLRGCTGLTGAPGAGFAQLTALTRLESLDLTNCDSLQARLRFSHPSMPEGPRLPAQWHDLHMHW